MATKTTTAGLEPIDRLEEKIKTLVNLIGRLKNEQARAADDNSRLQHEVEALQARLKQEYDAEPAPETRALVTAVRARVAAGGPEPEPASRMTPPVGTKNTVGRLPSGSRFCRPRTLSPRKAARIPYQGTGAPPVSLMKRLCRVRIGPAAISRGRSGCA